TPSLFVIDRSAAAADMTSTSVALLLPEFGSFEYVTVAVFEIDPEALLLTVHVAPNVTVPAAPTTTCWLMSPTPNAFGQLPPLDAEQVQMQPARLLVNVSATVTLLTALALGFVTTMLYVVAVPGAIADTPSDFAIDRSADGAVHAPLELLGHGSQASPSESPSALAWSWFSVAGQLSWASQMPSPSPSPGASVPRHVQALPTRVFHCPSWLPFVTVPRVSAHSL